VNILGVDLGTTTGWASTTQADGVRAGKWKLATAAEITAQHRTGGDRNRDIRIPRLFDFLADKIRKEGIGLLVFEDVLFVRNAMQGQLWASLRSCIWLQTGPGGVYEVKLVGVPVQTLKKFATGRGDASKEKMMAAAEKKFPVLVKNLGKTFDDNVADALHLMHYGYSITI
jgi:Holliday junction resolvasome RuvABC endonuclease subunit